MADPSEPDPGDIEERIGRLERQMQVLSETVQEMATTIRHLADRTSTPPTSPVAGEPAHGNGSEAGDELEHWVRWLVRRYELDDIPACWAQHGAFVEELEALRAGWWATIGQGAPGMEAMTWHDLAGRAVDRMRSIWRTCTDGTHRPWSTPDWVEEDTADDRNEGI